MGFSVEWKGCPKNTVRKISINCQPLKDMEISVSLNTMIDKMVAVQLT